MEKYYNEMDNLERGYEEIAKEQYERISQRNIQYTDFLCWILEQKNNDYDLAIIKGNDWDYFYNSVEETDINMIITEAENFYEEFRKVSNVDLMNENCFVSMTYIWDNGNDVNLIINKNGINKRYVISVIG